MFSGYEMFLNLNIINEYIYEYLLIINLSFMYFYCLFGIVYCNNFRKREEVRSK